MFELKVITHFAAAHRLKMVAKKCENMHGHNWKIEVCVGGKRLNKAGVIIDFGKIKRYVAEIIASLTTVSLMNLIVFVTRIHHLKISPFILPKNCRR